VSDAHGVCFGLCVRRRSYGQDVACNRNVAWQ
jgi:hypothetical protein